MLRGSLALRNPSIQEVAEALNLRSAGSPEGACDMVVVGAGPAGLGAAVYAASEGLDTVLVDSAAVGGQASTSTRIENYLGFPAGISGADLAERASMQATRFGVRTVVPANAQALTFEDGYHVVELDGDERLRARTVVLATGASYRRLPVARLADFEGAGVYYAATEVEGQMCAGDPVVVVGGGNSAGQAAMFLSGHAGRVNLLVRRADLAATMSRYLIDQIEATPGIELHAHTEVRELHGNDSLEAITIEDTAAGETRRVDASAMFVFIGADPCTAWLGGALATDEDGFVFTGQELQLYSPRPRGRESPTRTVRARDQPPGSVRRRRRALRLDQAGGIRGRRRRDGRSTGPRLSRAARRRSLKEVGDSETAFGVKRGRVFPHSPPTTDQAHVERSVRADPRAPPGPAGSRASRLVPEGARVSCSSRSWCSRC